MATHTGLLNPRSRRLACGFAIAGLLLAAPRASSLAGPMQDEKLWTEPVRAEFTHPRLPALMRGALAEDTDLSKIRAMAEIIRYKMTDLAGDVAAALKDDSAIVRASALRTLDELDAGAQAPAIAPFAEPRERYSPEEIEQTVLADRMLSRWLAEEGEGEALRALPAAWAKRALDAGAPLTVRRSALEAMARTSTPQSVAALVRDRSLPLALRLTAAEAQARFPGPADDPVALAQALVVSDPLIAVRLAGASPSPAAVAVLERLAADPSSAVQAAALRRLAEIDPALVQKFAPAAMRSSDPSVRIVPAKALAAWKSPAAVELLLATLNDEHPDVRTAAHASLRTLAGEASLYDAVAAGLVKTLDASIAEARAGSPQRWREAERAAILAGEIGYKPAHEKLVLLFAHPRAEVPMAAVIGLRPLAVESTYPRVTKLMGDVLDRMQAITPEARAKAQGMFRGEQVEANAADSALVEEAAQTLGVWRYRPADPVLRRLIPKDSAGFSPARSAGIWALGLIHEDKLDAGLATAMSERIRDMNPNNPESNDVRLACVVALGRMKAAGELGVIRSRIGQDSIDVQCASRWAVTRITGNDPGEIKLDPVTHSDAFITPLD